MPRYYDDELENGPREREYHSEPDPDELYESARERAWSDQWHRDNPPKSPAIQKLIEESRHRERERAEQLAEQVQ